MCASTSISHTVTPFMCLCPVCTSVWVSYNSSNKFTHHPLLVNICPIISVACQPNEYTTCYHLHLALFHALCSFVPKFTIDAHTTSPVPVHLSLVACVRYTTTYTTVTLYSIGCCVSQKRKLIPKGWQMEGSQGASTCRLT